MEIHSEKIDKIGAAMAKCQSAIHGAAKNAKNPHFKSDYADLASVWDAIRIPMTENELAAIQTIDSEDNKEYLITTVLHSSGQWFKSKKYLKPGRVDNMQGDGSAITYARRYSLAAIMGVPQVDDDGNKCDGARAPKPTIIKPLDQLVNLIGKFTEGFKNEEKKTEVCGKLEIKSLADLKTKDDATLYEMIKYMKTQV